MSKKDQIVDMLGDLTRLIEKLDEPELAPLSDRVPMQPLQQDAAGIARFRANPIVRYLLDAGPFNLNDIALLPNIPQEDRAQFAQLIGYSVSGYGDLDYALNVEEADAEVLKMMQRA